jgi:hypothetical protein
MGIRRFAFFARSTSRRGVEFRDIDRDIVRDRDRSLRGP